MLALRTALTVVATGAIVLANAPAEAAPAPTRVSPSSVVASAKTNRSALTRARAYLRYTFFSKSGLYEQLRYEGFSTAASRYAVDAVGANWSKNAAGKGRQYLNLMSFSRERLREQLRYEGFTDAEVRYALRQLFPAPAPAPVESWAPGPDLDRSYYDKNADVCNEISGDIFEVTVKKNTTCVFGRNVLRGWEKATANGSKNTNKKVTFKAYSPTTKKTYLATCAPVRTVRSPVNGFPMRLLSCSSGEKMSAGVLRKEMAYPNYE